MNADAIRAYCEELITALGDASDGCGWLNRESLSWDAKEAAYRARLEAALAEPQPIEALTREMLDDALEAMSHRQPRPPLEGEGETLLDGLTRIGMRHAGEGVRLLGPDDPIYPQEWLDELTSASRVPPEYLRPENTAEQAKRFNREYYGTFPPEPPKEGE